MKFWTTAADPNRLEPFSPFAGSPCELDGCFMMQGLIERERLQAVRAEVLRLLDAVERRSLGRPDDRHRPALPRYPRCFALLRKAKQSVGGPRLGRVQGGTFRDFQEETETRLRRLLGARPALRPPLMQALRRLPLVQGLSSHPKILEALKAIGMVCPVERVSSLQVFLPWEELFRERPHQDFGDMLAEQSWTLQIPLHDIIKEDTGAAEVYPGTYQLGPLTHHLVQDPDNHHWYETTDEQWWKGRPLKSFNTTAGDAVFFRCLNIHQTYPAQRRIRWSMVIRYDDAADAPILQTGANPFDGLRAYDFKIWSDQLQAFFKDYRVPGHAQPQRAGQERLELRR